MKQQLSSKNKKTLPSTKKNREPEKREDKKERSKPLASNSVLPLVSVLGDRADMKRATKLLEHAHAQKKIRDAADKEVTAAKEELAAFALTDELPGLRYGLLAIQVNGYKTRQTFDKDLAKSLMLEYGVPPEKIGGCYKESDEYLDTKLVELA